MNENLDAHVRRVAENAARSSAEAVIKRLAKRIEENVNRYAERSTANKDAIAALLIAKDILLEACEAAEPLPAPLQQRPGYHRKVSERNDIPKKPEPARKVVTKSNAWDEKERKVALQAGHAVWVGHLPTGGN